MGAVPARRTRQWGMRMSRLSRWNPRAGRVRARGRSPLRLGAARLSILGMTGAVLVGAVVSSAIIASPGPAGAAQPSPVSGASTSTRGVTGGAINVVFPVVALSSLAGREGFAEDAEYGEQTKAIELFVKQINRAGGIRG